MLTDDTHISKWHSTPTNSKKYWISLERIALFIIVLTYSGLWIALLMGPPSEKPTMIVQDIGPLARASWFPTYLALMGLIALNIRKFLSACLKFWPLLILWGLTIASISGSIDPDMTQRRVIALSFTFMFGFYLAIRAPLLDTLKIVGWAWATICVLNLLIIFGVPQAGIHSELHHGAWRGYLIEKNHLGGEMARANLLFLALIFLDGRTEKGKRKNIWWIGLGLSWLLILGSTSKTALIATTLPYIGVLFYQIAIRTPVLGLIAFWVGISLTGIAFSILTFFPEAVVALIGKDLTFTGRTDIWAIVIELINQNPLSGFGYGAFWVTENGPVSYIVDRLQWEVPTAHNSWLEIGLDLGYPGLILIICVTLFALLKAGVLATGKHGPFLFLFVIQMVMFSLSESLLMLQNTHASALFFFYISYILVAKRVSPESETPQLSAPYWAQPPRTTRKR